MFRNDGNGILSEVTGQLGLNAHQNDAANHHDVAPLFMDYDNDRDLDLYITFSSQGGEPLPGHFYTAQEGSFSLLNPDPLQVLDTWSAIGGDWDADGDQDIVMGSRFWGTFGVECCGPLGNGGPLQLFENQVSSSSPGININLAASASHPVVLGSKLTLWMHDGTSATRLISSTTVGEGAAVPPQQQHFGFKGAEPRSVFAFLADGSLQAFSLSDRLAPSHVWTVQPLDALPEASVCYFETETCSGLEVTYPATTMGEAPHRNSVYLYQEESSVMALAALPHTENCPRYTAYHSEKASRYLFAVGKKDQFASLGIPTEAHVKFIYAGRSYTASNATTIVTTPCPQRTYQLFLPLVSK